MGTAGVESSTSWKPSSETSTATCSSRRCVLFVFLLSKLHHFSLFSCLSWHGRCARAITAGFEFTVTVVYWGRALSSPSLVSCQMDTHVHPAVSVTDRSPAAVLPPTCPPGVRLQGCWQPGTGTVLPASVGEKASASSSSRGGCNNLQHDPTCFFHAFSPYRSFYSAGPPMESARMLCTFSSQTSAAIASTQLSPPPLPWCDRCRRKPRTLLFSELGTRPTSKWRSSTAGTSTLHRSRLSNWTT